MTGICAELRVDDPAGCPLAGAACTVSSVSRGTQTGASEAVTEEFTVSATDAGLEAVDAEPIFSYDDSTVYRFSRAADQECVCDLVEQAGCTVRQIQVVDGRLVLTFLATEVKTIRDVVADLREAHEGVQIRRLTRSDHGDQDGSTVVDLDILTARQREVLETAHEKGYFEHPKDAGAGEVAAVLDIATSTFTEHLAAAQNKLLVELLDRPEQSSSARPTVTE